MIDVNWNTVLNMRNEKTIDELTIKYQSGIRFIKEELDSLMKYSLEDPMRFEKATVIATKLRVMLLDRGRNLSLLGQLKIKEHLLFQAECIDSIDMASNLVFSSPLVSLTVHGDGTVFCTPRIPEFHHKLSCTFEVWWNEIVLDTHGDNGAIVSRKDVVLTLCNKEGGAHEDRNHSAEYIQVNDQNGFSVIDNKGNCHKVQNNYYVESLVAIAYEFLDAIEVYETYIKNSNLKLEGTDFTIIEITYDVDQYSINRYCPNTNQNLNLSIIAAFDYYRNVRCSVIQLIGYCFIDKNKKQMIRFLVIDNTNARGLVYLNSNQGVECRAVLMEKNGGYILVEKDDDIINCEDVHDFSYFEDQLSHRDNKAYLYELFGEEIPGIEI